jgi:hypothetical protein
MEDTTSSEDNLAKYVPSERLVLSIKIANVISFTILILLNILSSVGVFGNETYGQLSDIYQTSITPAPYSLSIWAIIFSLQAAFLVLQFLPMMKDPQLPYYIQRMHFFVPISWILQGVWLIAFGYEIISLSMVCDFHSSSSPSLMIYPFLPSFQFTLRY